MAMYICNKCGKEFKTTQHLNQHKNRKKSCVKENIVSLDSSPGFVGEIDVIEDTQNFKGNITNNNDLFFQNSISEIEKNINYANIIKFLKTYNCLLHLIKDKESVLEYKKQIEELKDENTKLKRKLETIYKTISPQY